MPDKTLHRVWKEASRELDLALSTRYGGISHKGIHRRPRLRGAFGGFNVVVEPGNREGGPRVTTYVVLFDPPLSEVPVVRGVSFSLDRKRLTEKRGWVLSSGKYMQWAVKWPSSPAGHATELLEALHTFGSRFELELRKKRLLAESDGWASSHNNIRDSLERTVALAATVQRLAR